MQLHCLNSNRIMFSIASFLLFFICVSMLKISITLLLLIRIFLALVWNNFRVNFRLLLNFKKWVHFVAVWLLKLFIFTWFYWWNWSEIFVTFYFAFIGQFFLCFGWLICLHLAIWFIFFRFLLLGLVYSFNTDIFLFKLRRFLFDRLSFAFKIFIVYFFGLFLSSLILIMNILGGIIIVLTFNFFRFLVFYHSLHWIW